MSGPDVVKNMSEEIFRVCRDAGIDPRLAAIIQLQHEEILTLQAYCKELSNHVEKIIGALRLTQALHKENKNALDKINAKFQDPYINDVKAEQTNEH